MRVPPTQINLKHDYHVNHTEAEQTIAHASLTLKKLRKRIRRLTSKAIQNYAMIEDGQLVMACLSGGKDSYVMLDMLLELQRIAPINFRLIAVNLDQKQPGFPSEVLPDYLSRRGVEYHVLEYDTYSVVQEKIPQGKTPCSLCSRLRRGILYSFAKDIGADRIALGHHMDDMVETLFLNMFFGGKLKAMPPKLLSDNREHMVIRPLVYCREQELAKYAQLMEFPIIPCNLCGVAGKKLQRSQIKAMLQDWQQQYPGRIESIFNSMQNIAPSQLADRELFDFCGLDAHQQSEN